MHIAPLSQIHLLVVANQMASRLSEEILQHDNQITNIGQIKSLFGQKHREEKGDYNTKEKKS